jgi:hypothetical protein
MVGSGCDREWPAHLYISITITMIVRGVRDCVNISGGGGRRVLDVAVVVSLGWDLELKVFIMQVG